ncbi:MAG: EamA family transporter [Bacillota bacterium]
MASPAKHRLLLAWGVLSLSTAATCSASTPAIPWPPPGGPWPWLPSSPPLGPSAGLVSCGPYQRHSFWGFIGSGAALAAHFTLWVYALRLTFVASAVTVVCLQPVFAMIKELPASTISTYILGAPIGSTILAAFLLGEQPGWQSFLGGMMVLAGLAWFFRWKPASPADPRCPLRARGIRQHRFLATPRAEEMLGERVSRPPTFPAFLVCTFLQYMNGNMLANISLTSLPHIAGL